jgi:hypothetical protein
MLLGKGATTALLCLFSLFISPENAIFFGWLTIAFLGAVSAWNLIQIVR